MRRFRKADTANDIKTLVTQEFSRINTRFGKDGNRLVTVRKEVLKITDKTLSEIEKRYDNHYTRRTYAVNLVITPLKRVFGNKYYNTNLKTFLVEESKYLSEIYKAGIKKQKIAEDEKLIETHEFKNVDMYVHRCSELARTKLGDVNSKAGVKSLYIKTLGLLGLSGRRPIEIMKVGTFTPISTNFVEFSGQAKKRNSKDFVYNFEILGNMTASEFCNEVNELRKGFKAKTTQENISYSELDNANLHNATANLLGQVSRLNFSQNWESRQFVTKDTRAIYLRLILEKQAIRGDFDEQGSKKIAMSVRQKGLFTEYPAIILERAKETAGHENTSATLKYLQKINIIS